MLDDQQLTIGVWETAQGASDLNGDGDSSDVVLHLAALNHPPVAQIDRPFVIELGRDLTLDGRESSDLDGDETIVEYAWDLDNDGQFDDAVSSESIQVVSAASIAALGLGLGDHPIALRVTDALGEQSVGISTLRQIETSVELISEGAADSLGNKAGGSLPRFASSTPDGRYLVYQTTSGTLARNDFNGDSDIFVEDTETGELMLVSVAINGETTANDGSVFGAISDDGRYVVFMSDASDLVSNDTNGVFDVFIRDLQTGTTELVSANVSGTDSGNGSSSAEGAEGPSVRSISSDGSLCCFPQQCD